MNKTPTTIKNGVRAQTFAKLYQILGEEYGFTKIFRVGDSEIAVEVATAPTGEPIYATFSPTVKDYCERKTKTKTIDAYNPFTHCQEYDEVVKKRENDKIKAEHKKKEKIARDKAAREKKKMEKEGAN